MASKIIGCGGYLPQKVLTNDDLAQFIDTSDEWIRTRTGIAKRYIAAENEFSSHMAHEAALAAITDASISVEEIDLIIVCSNTPDNSFPGVANKLQSYLNLKNTPSFDLQAICSGFIYGLHIADGMIKSGMYKTILLVCAEKMSSLLDWQDRSTAVLFGDGAGAIILQHSDSNAGIIDSHINSDGSMYDILYTNGGVSSTKTSGTIQMNGPEVFKMAIEKMSSSVNQIMQKNNFTLADIDYFIPHQANIRIINNIATKLGIDFAKVITTIEKHANCSAASIPLALNDLKKTNKIKSGDIIVFTAFGAGATWGSAIIRW
ncbi:MAG: ketoacyl-ACP synthase III [Rickettsiales bacterium]|nr:MAG: ketoacyl-ACP synthase III [Rickettsiales bacterium]